MYYHLKEIKWACIEKQECKAMRHLIAEVSREDRYSTVVKSIFKNEKSTSLLFWLLQTEQTWFTESLKLRPLPLASPLSSIFSAHLADFGNSCYFQLFFSRVLTTELLAVGYHFQGIWKLFSLGYWLHLTAEQHRDMSHFLVDLRSRWSKRGLLNFLICLYPLIPASWILKKPRSMLHRIIAFSRSPANVKTAGLFQRDSAKALQEQISLTGLTNNDKIHQITGFYFTLIESMKHWMLSLATSQRIPWQQDLWLPIPSFRLCC